MISTSKINVLFFALMALFTACQMEDTFNEAEQFEKDVDIITSYIAENNIDAYLIGTSGVFISYKYIDYNQQEYPSFSASDDSLTYITFGYKGYLSDGTVFDQTEADSTIEYYLEGLIPGWQIGISQMTAGDSATLYIPSLYGYENREMTNIPANSVLIFDIYLESFENRIY